MTLLVFDAARDRHCFRYLLVMCGVDALLLACTARRLYTCREYLDKQMRIGNVRGSRRSCGDQNWA